MWPQAGSSARDARLPELGPPGAGETPGTRRGAGRPWAAQASRCEEEREQLGRRPQAPGVLGTGRARHCRVTGTGGHGPTSNSPPARGRSRLPGPGRGPEAHPAGPLQPVRRTPPRHPTGITETLRPTSLPTGPPNTGLPSSPECDPTSAITVTGTSPPHCPGVGLRIPLESRTTHLSVCLPSVCLYASPTSFGGLWEIEGPDSGFCCTESRCCPKERSFGSAEYFLIRVKITFPENVIKPPRMDVHRRERGEGRLLSAGARGQRRGAQLVGSRGEWGRHSALHPAWVPSHTHALQMPGRLPVRPDARYSSSEWTPWPLPPQIRTVQTSDSRDVRISWFRKGH